MIYIPRELPIKCIAPFSYILVLMRHRSKILTTQEILYSMNFKNTEYNRRWLNDCIKRIGILKGININKIDQNKYEFKIVKYKPGTFYQCDFKDIQRILKLENSCNKLTLAGYYAILSSTINNKTRVGNCYSSVLCKKTGLSKKTLCTYNKILEDHKIIFMIHSTIKGKPNYYGLAENYNYVIKEAQDAGLWLPRKYWDPYMELN